MFITPTGTPPGGFSSVTPVPASWFNYVSNNFPRAIDGVGGGYYQLAGADLRIASNTRIVKFNQADPSFPLELRGYVTIGLTDEGDYATGVGSFSVNTVGLFTLGLQASNSTTNGDAIGATGNGTGRGLSATGGSNGGTGVLAQGGVTNGKGLEAIGAGTGAGAVCTGGAGAPGIQTSAGGGDNAGIEAFATGTGPALDCKVGGVKFSGTQPTAGTDPGANVMHGTHIVHAWARIHTNGAGAVTVQDNVNVSGATVTATHIEVTFAGAFASTNYAPQSTNLTSHSRLCSIDDVSLTTTTCQIVIYDSVTGAIVNPSTTAVKVSLSVNGRR